MINLSIQKRLSSPAGSFELRIKSEIASKSFVTIYGKSGAGKTSILRILSGLMRSDEGSVQVDGETWEDTRAGINIRPSQRQIGFVFQETALFPNMTVNQNLQFATSRRAEDILDDIIQVVDIGSLLDRDVQTLSGGQKQRVALARSLAQKPKILLLDEPLSALDASSRTQMQEYLQKVHKSYGLTTILVSHDIPEILKLSDKVIYLEEGSILKEGKPEEVLTNQEISGKFQFTGEIVKIEEQDFLLIISILIGNDLVRVVADKHSENDYNAGDKVLVASKAFNPIIRKIS